MTHKIYFEKRCIVICPMTDKELQDPNSIWFTAGEGLGIHSLTEMFRSCPSLQKVCIPSADVEGTYRKLKGEFLEVNAAGGLVSNRRGDYLMIRRYDCWDLPKGHQEPGEDIMTCAEREVSEETGLGQLQTRSLICVTDHIYYRNDRWHLKHTWWYDMLYTAPVELIPQTEEDITKAVWVPRSAVPAYLTNTFPSIAEVFRKKTF